ncbi:SDR family oxidoreductase [Cesiribacter sp. SM1]|uniref:SDR family oxidoreductase n=1 Tax=Cesiribacter sp. SM1 TaxID=2861196 RepID=UPI001CD231E1|nr:SDR family oxidoreductase [Cesiribacter sp. SM1]
MNLQEAKIIITGGSSGIGKETARLLKAKGAQVTIAARHAGRLQQTAEQLGVHWVQADVGNEDDVVRLMQEASKKMGGLNVLINNAGWGYAASLTQLNAERFMEVYRTNVLGAALCAREAARIFTRQKEGNIINIGSTAALKGSANSSPYTATKFALRGMTECWRAELREHNIRVMLVNPSEVMTEFASNKQEVGGQKEKKYTPQEEQTKLRAQEIAHTIVAMLEMDSRGFITESTVFATNPQV